MPPDNTLHPLYPLGVYYVKQDENNVYFVKPVLKTDQISTDGVTKEFISGDHFSMSLVPFTAKNNEIHLHYTCYTPVPTNLSIGQIIHYPRNVFMNGAVMPFHGYTTSVFDKMGGFKNTILDVCREYIYEKVPKKKPGGGLAKKARPSRAKPSRASKASKTSKTSKASKTSNTNTNNLVSLELSRLLDNLQVKRIIGIGYKNDNDEWEIMVDFIRPESSQLERELSMTLKKPSYASFQKELIKRLLLSLSEDDPSYE